MGGQASDVDHCKSVSKYIVEVKKLWQNNRRFAYPLTVDLLNYSCGGEVRKVVSPQDDGYTEVTGTLSRLDKILFTMLVYFKTNCGTDRGWEERALDQLEELEINIEGPTHALEQSVGFLEQIRDGKYGDHLFDGII